MNETTKTIKTPQDEIQKTEKSRSKIQTTRKVQGEIQTTQKAQSENNQNQTAKDDFIMRPTVDVCFAGLMENPKVRKGFCAAILRISPESIRDTELLQTHLQRDYADEKLGILDVRVRLLDGLQINMEMQVKYFEFWDERALFYLCKMFAEQLRAGEPYEKLRKCIHVSILDFIHFPEDTECYRTIGLLNKKTNAVYSDKLELQILELKKLPGEVRTGDDIVNWMRFFKGKSKEEFERMAKTSEYLGEAYEALQKLSADDQKRLEYEAREKALKDYNTQMGSAERRGRREGIHLTKKVLKLQAQGKSEQEIIAECGITAQEVREILA